MLRNTNFSIEYFTFYLALDTYNLETCDSIDKNIDHQKYDMRKTKDLASIEPQLLKFVPLYFYISVLCA